MFKKIFKRKKKQENQDERELSLDSPDHINRTRITRWDATSLTTSVDSLISQSIIIDDQPSTSAETDYYSKPGTSAESDYYSKPSTSAESDYYSKPGTSAETDYYGKPRTSAETSYYSKPGTSAETGYYSKPGTSAESDYYSKPGTSAETDYYSKPGTSAETDYYSKPGTSAETDYYSKPGTSAETGYYSKPGTSAESDYYSKPGTSAETDYYSKPGTSAETDYYSKPGTSAETDYYSKPGTSAETDYYSKPGTSAETGYYSKPGPSAETGYYSKPGTSAETDHYSKPDIVHGAETKRGHKPSSSVGFTDASKLLATWSKRKVSDEKSKGINGRRRTQWSPVKGRSRLKAHLKGDNSTSIDNIAHQSKYDDFIKKYNIVGDKNKINGFQERFRVEHELPQQWDTMNQFQKSFNDPFSELVDPLSVYKITDPYDITDLRLKEDNVPTFGELNDHLPTGCMYACPPYVAVSIPPSSRCNQTGYNRNETHESYLLAGLCETSDVDLTDDDEYTNEEKSLFPSKLFKILFNRRRKPKRKKTEILTLGVRSRRKQKISNI